MDTADRTIIGLIILLAILAIGMYVLMNTRTAAYVPYYNTYSYYPVGTYTTSSSSSNYNYALPASAYSSSYYYSPGTTTYYTNMPQPSAY